MPRLLALAVAAFALTLPSVARADACSAAGLEGDALAACQKLVGPCKYQRGSAKAKCEAKAVERAVRTAAPREDRSRSQEPASSGSSAGSAPEPVAAPEPEPTAAPEPVEEPEPAEEPEPTYSEEELRADAEEIAAAVERVRELGNRSERELSQHTSPKVGEVVPNMLEKLEAQEEALAVAAAVRPVHERFTERHTAHLEDWESASNAVNSAFRGVAERVGDNYVEVEIALEQIDEAPPRNAARCLEVLEKSGTDPDYLANLHELYRVKAIVEARAMLDICPSFAPDDPGVAAKVASLRPVVEQTLEEYKAEEMEAIKGRTWKSSVSGVSSAGLSYLRGQRDWGGDTSRGTQVLAVSVQGDWFVAERNIFGAPTRYGLPVHVAITNDGTMEGTAQVFDLSLVTASPTKAPPFEQYRVGNTWLILRERVP